MSLVPYAGKDQFEGTRGYYPSRLELYGNGKQERAYLMFLAGRDTFYIANRLRVDESRVLEWVTIERSAHLNLPNPYGAKL